MASVITTANGIDMHYEVFHPRATKTLVLLHGFTGSTKTWQHVIERLSDDIRVFAIDLIGHGLTASPTQLAPYTMDAQVAMLEAFFAARNLTSFTLLGYSMGGRTALSYAMKHPERIEKLILESTSPGLAIEEERAARRESDAKLAARILDEGIEAFTNFWQDIPLFNSQKALPQAVQAEVRAERLAQNPIGLANSLKGMGTGAQRSYWQTLATFERPVSLITGELDVKFYQKARDMQETLQKCSHHVAKRCGHAIHVENPELFVTIVEKEI
jgi:2-succinyl-6-hydroxy-2,4-cyclohexadiene-1-carboxylate synthase